MPAPKKLNTEEKAEVKDDVAEAVVIPDPNAYAGPTDGAPPAVPPHSPAPYAGPTNAAPSAAVPHVPAPFAEPKKDEREEHVSAPYAGPGGGLPESKMYKVGDWAGRANYECKLCPYSTLEKENILAHIIERHSGVESKVVKDTHS